MLVKDLVWLDEEGKFRNDVQLSHYEDEKINQSLIGCYIFSYDAPRGYLSAVNLLRSVINAYLNPQAHKNRTVVIGQYGHGKSHLGLVMANYFGKAHTSTEFKTVISRLQRAIDNPAKLEIFKEFRVNRPEFLVIRLSGDNPKSLREQFMLALEKGLKEHDSTKNEDMPFWQETAKRLLKNLNGTLLEEANKFLEKYSTEVVLLLQEIESYSDHTYQIIVDLFTHIHGVAPNLGGEISMKEVLNWAGKKFCGKNGSLGGILILFDEFSLFIQNQSKRSGSGELQDLLNGVKDQEGKAMFVAFSQHDPKTIAREVVQGVGLENLEKELNRIEGELILYSLMESVIDAYLTQSDDNWTVLRSNPKVRGPLVKASNLCMEIFRDRYEDTLRWMPETFDEIVQKGCFPLHPITTAVLCDIQLQAVQHAGNPRTVLGFVERVVREKADQNALLEDDSLNWVNAIELVDYFYEYLKENPRLLYETAISNLTADSPHEYDKLLKALLLEEIIKIRRDRQTQVEFLSEAAGLDLNTALGHLKSMARAQIILYNPTTGINTFMPIASNPNRLRDLLNRKKEDFDWDWSRFQEMNKSKDFSSLDVNVNWGHPSDWCATQHVLISDFFDDEHLRLLVKKYEIGLYGFSESSRGVVIWLLARTPEEVTEIRAKANQILDSTFNEEHPIPIVVMLPDKPCPELLDSYKTLKSLDKFTNEERKEVGQAVYQQQIMDAGKAYREGIESLRGDGKLYKNQIRKVHSITAPKAYRAHLQSRGDNNLNGALTLVYELAYRLTPPEFFTQYKVTQVNLRNAVKTTAAVLFKNKLSISRDMLQTQKVAQDLCDKFLVNKWGILANDYSISDPSNHRIAQAWDLLNNKITIGSKDVQLRTLLSELLSPPFGYDYNTALLLFSAWLGYNATEVKYTINGTLNSVDEIVEILTNAKGVKEFLEAVTGRQTLSISRINLGDVINEVKAKVKRVYRSNFSQNDAAVLIQELEAHSQTEAINEDVRIQAREAAEYLKTALENAKVYDSQGKEINEKINSDKLENLISIPTQLQKLPTLGNVEVISSSPDELRALWQKKFAESIEKYCQKYETVQDLTEVGRNKEILTRGKKDVNRVSPNLVSRFEKALELLAQDEQRLKVRDLEAPTRAQIATMKTALPYIDLVQFRSQLERLVDLSDETMALRDEKLSQINTEISQLETFANGLMDGVSEIGSDQDAKLWRTQYFQSQTRFEGSAFEKSLGDKMLIVERLHDFYSEIGQVDQTSFSSPTEIDVSLEKLKEIEKNFSKWISDKNKKFVVQLRSKIEGIRVKKEAEANKWAESVIKDAEKGNHQDFLLKVKVVPLFLPEKEKKVIQGLVVKAEKELEKDIVSKIEHEFQQIKDKNIQKECLTRLQAIVSKENGITK